MTLSAERTADFPGVVCHCGTASQNPGESFSSFCKARAHGEGRRTAPGIRQLAERFPRPAAFELTPEGQRTRIQVGGAASISEHLARALALAAAAQLEDRQMGRFESLAAQLHVLQRAFPEQTADWCQTQKQLQ